jgi:hypothetical protein
MNILYIVADGFREYNSSNFRVSYLADALREAGHKIMIVNVKHWLEATNYAKEALNLADIVHIQRVLIDTSHESLEYWKSRGKPIVVDVDDHYELILPDNASADFWLHGLVTSTLPDGKQHKKKLGTHPLDQFKQGLNRITALTSPSKVLCDRWKEFLPSYVIPNYVKLPMYRAANKANNGNEIVLFWGGSLSHTQSWKDSGIEEALQRILWERGNVYLLVVGDARVRDALPLPRDKVRFMNYAPYWHWPKVLKMGDIGLAPLAGDYDDGRSSLKVTEYVSAQIPFVASNSIVYEEFRDTPSGKLVLHGNDTKYEDRVEEWYYGTIDVIDNYRYYYNAALEIDATPYDAASNVDYVISQYEQIIEWTK